MLLSFLVAGLMLYRSRSISSSDSEISSQKSFSESTTAGDESDATAVTESNTDSSVSTGTDTNADDIYAEATNSFKEGDYYKYDGTVSLSVTVKVPEYPSANVSMSMDMTQEGKVDIQKDYLYSKITQKMEGLSETSESYVIGDDIYVKTGSGTFEKYTFEEAEESGFILADSLDSDFYEFADNQHSYIGMEKIDGIDCYYYQVEVDEVYLDSFTNYFNRSFEQATGGYKASDIKYSGSSLGFWVSEDTQLLLKAELIIKKITMEINADGIVMNLSIDDVVSSNLFFDWGKKVEIEAPI